MSKLSRFPARETILGAVLERVAPRLVGWDHRVILLAVGRGWRRRPSLALVPVRVGRPS
jgi:hypothetical protein